MTESTECHLIVEISKELRKKLKMKALKKDMTLRELVTEMLTK